MSFTWFPKKVGAIFHSQEKHYERFDWTILNFSSRTTAVYRCYHSPVFNFAKCFWYLELCNANVGIEDFHGKLYLIAQVLDSPKRVNYVFGVKTAEGKVEKWVNESAIFTKKCYKYGARKHLLRLKLLQRESELLPSDSLTITVFMRLYDPLLDISDVSVITKAQEFVPKNININEERQWPVKKDISDVSVITEAREFVPKDIKINKESQWSIMKDISDVSVHTEAQDIVVKGININVESQWSEKKGSEKLVEDIGKLLISGDSSDLTVKVRGVEFKAHRAILVARTPVLSAMFHHDTTEKASNEITIVDCEPGIFKEFLHYIYTGTVEDLTAQNVFALYGVADKYLTNDLKRQCVTYIQDTLCVETFCDAVKIAVTHREDKLLEQAIEFAAKNIRFIIQSVEWQKFIQEHSLLANEIFIKSFGP